VVIDDRGSLFGPRSPREARNKDGKLLGRREPRGVRWLAALLPLAGCTLIEENFLTNDFSGDRFPIAVDTSSGALLVGMRPVDRTAPQRAVLDLLSPFTLIDPGKSVDPSLRFVSLELLGKDDRGALTLPRARFPDAQLITLHPCAVPDGADPQQLPACSVGTQGAPQAIDAVLGADALAGDAVRLRIGDGNIFVLPDIGGSDRGRTLSCDAVFGAPYRGGGTLVIAGGELPFGNRRITLSACLGEDRDPGPQPTVVTQTGADALFVVSTSIGISIIDESTYERYRTLPGVMGPELAALPVDAVYLPSGLVSGRRAVVDRMALVGASISNGLSPCGHVYAHRMLADGPLAQMAGNADLNCADATMNACPCKDGTTFCAVPAVLELTPPAPGVDVLVVPDSEPTLQALRTELRPDQPEVNGLLGTDVLRAAEIDVDYPHDRLIARCAGPGCLARPQLTESRDRCQINHCIYGATDNLGCSGS